MKDQEREAEGAGEFKGQYSQYTISMKTQPNDSFLIEVEDSISFERWRMVIDGHFIEAQEDPFYLNIFAEPELIFRHIADNFSEVSFKPNMLNFICSFGPSKNKKTKVMTIPLEKEEKSPTDLVHVRINKMEQQLAKKLTQKDIRIKVLEEKSEKLEDFLTNIAQKQANMEKRQEEEAAKLNLEVRQLSNRIIKEEETNRGLQQGLAREAESNRQLQLKSKLLQQRLDKEEKINRELYQRIKRDEQRIKTIEEKLEKEGLKGQQVQDRLKKEEQRLQIYMKNIKDANAILVQQVQSFKERQKYCERFINIPQIAHNQGNPNSRLYYTLTNTPNFSAKITRIGAGSWQTFINKSEVFPRQQNKFAIKLIKTKNSNLMIGLCTEKGFGNYESPESIYYYCTGNGWLFEGGKSKQLAGCGSVDSEVVQCVADMFQGKVMWQKGGKILARCNLSAAMKGKPAYISISLINTGDIVQMSFP